MEYYEYNYKPNPLMGIWVILVGLVTLTGVMIADGAKAISTSLDRLSR
ncbi:hypothetical protein [Segetibacter sp. 3557_3]|nr:hypothetical protein [Segetibacter sp. 3557_3]